MQQATGRGQECRNSHMDGDQSLSVLGIFEGCVWHCENTPRTVTVFGDLVRFLIPRIDWLISIQLRGLFDWSICIQKNVKVA